MNKKKKKKWEKKRNTKEMRKGKAKEKHVM